MPNTSALLRNNNPRIVTVGYQDVSVPVATATLSHPVTVRLIRLTCRGARAALAGALAARDQPAQAMDWLASILGRIGDIIFMASDEEAYWRGWSVERRHAGLSRCYRDPVFDKVAWCPHCRGLGITLEDSLCVTCTGTGRVTLAGPPFPHDG